MRKVDIENSTANILLTINGEMHLVGMTQDNLDAITMLVKKATETAVKTGKTQAEFNRFLGYEG